MIYSYTIWTYSFARINVIKFGNIKTETWSCILLYTCAYFKKNIYNYVDSKPKKNLLNVRLYCKLHSWIKTIGFKIIHLFAWARI